jgi:hypothetical protein
MGTLGDFMSVSQPYATFLVGRRSFGENSDPTAGFRRRRALDPQLSSQAGTGRPLPRRKAGSKSFDA